MKCLVESSGDDFMNPPKLSKQEHGSSIPSSVEALFGSSPELSRKEATNRNLLHLAGHDYAGGHSPPRVQDMSELQQVGEVCSQQGTSNKHVSSKGEDFSDLDTSNQHMSSTEEESSDL